MRELQNSLREQNLMIFSLVRLFAKCLWPRGYVTLQKIKPTKKSSNFAREASFAIPSIDPDFLFDCRGFESVPFGCDSTGTGIYPFHLKVTNENRIKSSLKSNKKSGSILNLILTPIFSSISEAFNRFAFGCLSGGRGIWLLGERVARSKISSSQPIEY